MKVVFLAAALLGCAVPLPVSAQAASPGGSLPGPVMAVTPAQMGIVTEKAVEPARLAAARPVIDQIWPLGTYARVMQTMMDRTSQMVAAQMSGDNIGGDPAVRAALSASITEDPYAEERVRITMRVMGEEMGKFMSKFEPAIRDALVSAYARRFTVAQLGDLHTFFDTPTGRLYSTEAMTIAMGPDVMKANQAMMPELMKAMPGIMAKVQAATKDLPPPPKRKSK